MSDQDVIRQWTRLVQREEDEINLAEAALGIARTEYPRLDSGGQLARLDRMAAEVRASPAASAFANIEALNEYLFEKEKILLKKWRPRAKERDLRWPLREPSAGIPLFLSSSFFLSLSPCRPWPTPPHAQVGHTAGSGSRCARNFTSRLRFWAVAARWNCSATFQSRRKRTRRSPRRSFNSEKRASILFRSRLDCA